MLNDGSFTKTHMLPDYLNDLNAIHGAICQTIEGQDRFEFAYQLDEVVTRDYPGLEEADRDFFCENATAAQRAEAFLKTLGLWKETKA